MPERPSASTWDRSSAAGFRFRMQRGSHKVFVRDSDDRTVVVPWHNRDLKRGTLHALVKGTGLTIDEFQKFL